MLYGVKCMENKKPAISYVIHNPVSEGVPSEHCGSSKRHLVLESITSIKYSLFFFTCVSCFVYNVRDQIVLLYLKNSVSSFLYCRLSTTWCAILFYSASFQ